MRHAYITGARGGMLNKGTELRTITTSASECDKVNNAGPYAN
jgi:hypothetical protein